MISTISHIITLRNPTLLTRESTLISSASKSLGRAVVCGDTRSCQRMEYMASSRGLWRLVAHFTWSAPTIWFKCLVDVFLVLSSIAVEGHGGAETPHNVLCSLGT